MTTGIREAYFNLPSIRNFISKITDSLRDRNSVIVLLPKQIEEQEIIDEIHKILYSLDLEAIVLEVDSTNTSKPLDLMNSQYPANWDDVNVLRNTNSYIERTKKLPEVIMFSGITKLPKLNKVEWFKFLAEWAKVSHQIKNQGGFPSALAIIVRADQVLDILPESDLCLNIHWWWGIPSVLEIKLLCRIINLNELESYALSMWRENLIPSLSQDNLSLMEFLWSRTETNSENLIDELILFFETHPLEDEENNEIADLTFEKNKLATSTPSSTCQEYWAKGYLNSTPEYGVEFSTFALAKQKDKDELRHRIWRAQIDLLLPQIDNVRLDTCKYLTKIKGREWPFKWALPEDERQYQMVKENPLSTELGHLRFLLNKDSHFRDCSQLQRLINVSHNIRNQIAHYQGIDFNDYKDFIEEREESLS